MQTELFGWGLAVDVETILIQIHELAKLPEPVRMNNSFVFSKASLLAEGNVGGDVAHLLCPRRSSAQERGENARTTSVAELDLDWFEICYVRQIPILFF